MKKNIIQFQTKENKGKIITILGETEKQKINLIFSITKLIKDKKIVILNFDLFHSEQLESKKNNIEIIDINEILYKEGEQITLGEFIIEIEKLKSNYQYILINNSVENFLDYTKLILNQSKYILFFIHYQKQNIIKQKNILSICINQFHINKNKIYLLIDTIINKNIYMLKEELKINNTYKINTKIVFLLKKYIKRKRKIIKIEEKNNKITKNVLKIEGQVYSEIY